MSRSFQPKPDREDKHSLLAARVAEVIAAQHAPVKLLEAARLMDLPIQAARAGLAKAVEQGLVLPVGLERFAAASRLEDLRAQAAAQFGAKPFGPKELRQVLEVPRRDVMGWLDALQEKGWAARTPQGHIMTEDGLADRP